jgi:hypothetical protein
MADKAESGGGFSAAAAEETQKKIMDSDRVRRKHNISAVRALFISITMIWSLVIIFALRG